MGTIPLYVWAFERRVSGKGSRDGFQGKVSVKGSVEGEERGNLYNVNTVLSIGICQVCWTFKSNFYVLIGDFVHF